MSRTRIVHLAALTLIVGGVLAWSEALAQTCGEQQKLTASDAAASDFFGAYVAVSGDTAVAGAYQDDDAGVSSGSAYVYVRSGGVWTQQQKLTASDAAADDQFGAFLAVDGDTAVVGSFQDDDAGADSGSAYVFVRSGGVWTQQQKLTASDAAAGDKFGIAISISGDTAVVGAFLDDGVGTDSGSAYVFVRSAGVWTQQQKLTASDAAAGDNFGVSTAISGDTVVVGSNGNDDAGASSGSAYVFTRSGTVWTQQQKLTASDAAAGDEFGESVSVSGDTVLVGAYLDDGVGADSGSAYVFVRAAGVWTQQQKLTASDAAAGDFFGYSVSVSGDKAVAGAHFNDDAGTSSGSAYVYVRSAGVWTQQSKLTASDAAGNDRFGVSVSVSGDTVMVGAHLDNHVATDAGSAYVFTCCTPPDCNNHGTCTNGTCVCDPGFIGVGCDQCGPPQPDCNNNLIADGCDIADCAGDPACGDCNSNGIPDGCEIAAALGDLKLTASDAAAVDHFGRSVSISGDTAVVGAPSDDSPLSDAGSAYVFVRSAGVWTQQAKLTASDAAAADNFGNSVSVSGDTAVIGASSDNSPLSNAGSAYVFTRTGTVWTQQAKLTAADAAAGDNFGHSVSISGGTAVIGAWTDDSPLSDAGSAYVFTRSGTVWTQQAKLTDADAQSGDEFGYSVSISGDTAIIGAWTDDSPLSDAGSAYVFTRTGTVWTQQAKLTAADAAAVDHFGRSVSISGDTAVIGASGDNSVRGSAYVFTRWGTVWTQRAKLTASDGAANDVFGVSVSISGDTAVIGAYLDDSPLGDAGSAYIFDDINNIASDCNSNGVPDACDVAECAGDPACGDCNGNGVPDGCDLPDCNANGHPDVCDIAECAGDPACGDCNANGVPDGCDIAACTGDPDCGDCNHNGIPDLCDIRDCAGGAACADCDLNRVPDGCDIVLATSPDCNGNGVPDGCDLHTILDGPKLTASGAAAYDYFGRSVSMSGDTAVVGALFDDDAGTESGSAYVFFRSGGVWAQQQKVTASDAAAGDYFGVSVSVSGNTALVGAPDHDGVGANSGSAYVFVRSGGVWTQQQNLTALDAAASDSFGSSVSVDGDTAVVGATGDDDGGSASGSAYVFVRSGGVWTQQQKLTASDAAAGDYFGVSVSISGDTAVIGAFNAPSPVGHLGSAYVFVRSGTVWTQQAKLTAADGTAENYFGSSVSISGGTAIIGAGYANGRTGSAYVFVRSGTVWTQQAKLTASDAAAYDFFGGSVSISGDTAVIGAYEDDFPLSYAGSAYVFVRSGAAWTQRVKLTASDAAENGYFGNSVSISGDTAVIGADQDDSPLSNAGSAYVFDITDGPSPDCNANGIPDECDLQDCAGDPACADCNGNGIPDGCDIASGSSPDVSPADGVPDECKPLVIVWNADSLSPERTTRSLRFRVNTPVTTTASPVQSAIKVTMIDLQNPVPPNLPQNPPPDFSGYESSTCTAPGESNGCARWVGKPGTFLESQDSPGVGSYKAARLQCTPFYWDWVAETASGPIAVVGAEIAPSSTYSVQSYASICMGMEGGCLEVSTPVTMYTRRSGDVTVRFNPPDSSTQPDALDVAAVVNKLKNLSGALVKAITQLQPNLPELNADVNALDIVAVVDGVKQKAYAFSGPCPCPSLVQCDHIACSSVTPCVTAYGAGSQCVKTCSSGPNAGDPCINNGHCPGGGSCGNGFCRDRCGRCSP